MAVPAPFDHSKLLDIDESWNLFGSANGDSRSRWVKFELNVECSKSIRRLRELIAEEVKSDCF